MQFKHVLGHKEVKQRLISSVNEGRISHAQLFAGAEGSGALALAIAYAQYINCEQKQANDSCGKCSNCMKYAKLAHPDLHFSYPFVGSKELSVNFLPQWREALIKNPYMNLANWLLMLEAENKQGNITADECRDIIKRLSLKSFEGGYKILIMWMPEFLDKEGNILLKLIEEPPAQTLIILVAESPEQIISTIASRTQLVKLKKLPDGAIVQALIESTGVNESQATSIAHLVDGDYNTAVQMATGSVEDSLAPTFLDWMRKCYSLPAMKQDNVTNVLNWVDAASTWGRERQKNFLSYCIHIIRECMLINFSGETLVRLSGKDMEEYKRFAQLINANNCPSIAEALNDAVYHIERNANPKVLFMDLSISMARFLKVK